MIYLHYDHSVSLDMVSYVSYTSVSAQPRHISLRSSWQSWPWQSCPSDVSVSFWAPFCWSSRFLGQDPPSSLLRLVGKWNGTLWQQMTWVTWDAVEEGVRFCVQIRMLLESHMLGDRFYKSWGNLRCKDQLFVSLGQSILVICSAAFWLILLFYIFLLGLFLTCDVLRARFSLRAIASISMLTSSQWKPWPTSPPLLSSKLR